MNRVCFGKFTARRVALGVLLSQMFTPQAMPLAPYMAGGAEVAAAALSIPAKIAARHCAYKNNTKAAAMLYLTADTLNICRDVLYFWNQSQEASRRPDSRPITQIRPMFTDGIGYTAVNGVMTIRDLTKWGQHLGECMGLNSAVPATVDDEDFVDFDDKSAVVGHADDAATKPDGQVLDEQKISQLAYAWQVIALPSLEGLAAIAVAITQQGGPVAGSEEPLRRMATAAHALVRLLDERTMLKPDSKNAKTLDALLMISAIWLAYEIITYYQLPDPVPPVVQGDVKTADNGGGKASVATAAATGTNAATTATSATASVSAQQVPAPVAVVRVNKRLDTTASCRTCGTAFDEKDTIRVPLFQCGHAFCRDCLAGQIRVAAGEHKTAVSPCAFVGGRGERCTGVIVEQDIPHAIDPQDKDFATLMASYHDSSIEKGAATIQNIRHCPGLNCKFLYVVDPTEKVPRTCRTCNTTHCAYCLQIWNNPEHPAGPCVAPGAAPTGNEELRLWLEAHTRPCPGCGVAIEKNEHCNHMTCRQCSHEFCWLCGGPCRGGSHFASCPAAARAGVSGSDLWIHYHDEDNSGDVEWARTVRARFASAKQPQQ